MPHASAGLQASTLIEDFAPMRPSPFTRFHPAPLALAAAVTAALLAGHVPRAHAQADSASTPVAIDIPAQPLGQALNQLARQARLQLSFPSDLVAGKAAPAVSGSLTTRQALDRLLSGSGLGATVDGSTVVVQPAAAPGQAPTQAGEATLPAVNVSAKANTGTHSLGYLNKTGNTGALGRKPVLDTPFSITVVDSEELFERGAKSIGQIFANDAGVYTQTAASTTDWWGTQIRGLPVHNHYVDDIPVLLYWGGDFPTEVAESVTALKGLTGFMHGFGTPGGALSYQLKRPTQTPETSVSVSYRNPSLFSTHLDTSHNLGEELAVRLNLATDQGLAYNESKADRKVGSLAIDKHFGASLKWFTTVVFEDNRLKGEPILFDFGNYDAEGSGGKPPKVPTNHDHINVDNSYYNSETWLASTGLQWQINDRWDLKYQTGFSRKKHRSNKSSGYLLDSAGNYNGYSYNFAGKLDNTFNQTMLQGSLETGDIKHEIVTGLGLQRSKDRWGKSGYWANDFDGNIHQDQPFRTTRSPDFSFGGLSGDTSQFYAFASDTLHFGERWQAIVGLRFTDHDQKDVDKNPARDSGYKAHHTSPTLALIHKPDARTSIYGSYVEGLEAGTQVRPPYANAGETLGATVSKQYEVGVKHDAGSFDYTVALFRVERANQMDEFRDNGTYLTQDGLTIYRGLEVAGAYQLNRQLNVGLSSVYLDATIEKVSASNANLEGKTSAFAPKWQVVPHVQYRVAEVPGLKIHGNARYFGASYVTDTNTVKIPSRITFNTGFSYAVRLQEREWTIVGNVNNLFDKKYWAGGGTWTGTVGERRNFSLGLRTQF